MVKLGDIYVNIKIKIISVLPMPMSEQERSKYEMKNVQAKSYTDALEMYKKTMENKLPKGGRYGLEITDEKGVKYNRERIYWDRS